MNFLTRRPAPLAVAAIAWVPLLIASQSRGQHLDFVDGTSNGVTLLAESLGDTHDFSAFATGPDELGYVTSDFGGDFLQNSDFAGGVSAFELLLDYQWTTTGFGSATTTLDATFVLSEESPDWALSWFLPTAGDESPLVLTEVSTGEVLFEATGASGYDIAWLDAGVAYRIQMNYTIDFAENPDGFAQISMFFNPTPGPLALFAVVGLFGTGRRRTFA